MRFLLRLQAGVIDHAVLSTQKHSATLMKIVAAGAARRR
jgi:hypothetical protein